MKLSTMKTSTTSTCIMVREGDINTGNEYIYINISYLTWTFSCVSLLYTSDSSFQIRIYIFHKYIFTNKLGRTIILPKGDGYCTHLLLHALILELWISLRRFPTNLLVLSLVSHAPQVFVLSFCLIIFPSVNPFGGRTGQKELYTPSSGKSLFFFLYV